jgi:hypothetical protein
VNIGKFADFLPENQCLIHSTTVGSSSIVGYGVPNYSGINPPDAPNLQIERAMFSVNDTVLISWSHAKNAESYWLHIYRNGEDYINQTLNQDLSYSSQYPVGDYTAYVVSCNSVGETSSYVNFSVYDSAPDTPQLSINKQLASINDTITISWDSTKNTESYWLHIYRNGEDYINQTLNQDLSYSGQYPVGDYTAYIVSINSVGEMPSSVNFSVFEKIKGDINSDGSVTITDAVLLQKYLLNTYIFTKEQWELADMTGDGEVNVFDLCVMKNKLINS